MVVHIDGALCKGCDICVRHCPRGVLAITEETNRKGYNIVGVIHPDKCITCKLCEVYCPDLAIFVEKKGKTQTST